MTDVLDREERRGLSRGERQRGHAAFQRGDAFFQNRLGRIHNAGVDIAELLEREQVARVLGGIELVGRRLIDRHRHRMGGRVGAIASGMQQDGFCVMAFGRHDFSVAENPERERCV
jgi:anti-sigma factor RsiW